ncbi:unnamed protein product [Leptosia nina]|uniref:Uncharacterized protein n=1 Tax=Leptosia nina TaxID=320188 RepID=A0AAV1JAR1_9NEOP
MITWTEDALRTCFQAFVLICYAQTLALSATCEEAKKTTDVEQSKDKRQTQDVGSHHYYYRTARKQEPVAPVEEPQEDDKNPRDEQYRPGQVFSVNAQELLELQPQRKAPVASGQQLQHLYHNPQQEQKQTLQQFYYVDPQAQRQQLQQLQQVAPPSHAVIARPNYSSNGGEASVGAALSVSDTGSHSAEAYDQDLLALLGHSVQRPQAYVHTQAPLLTPTPAPQYQQIEQYITKPSKKPTKLRPKIHVAAQSTIAPQQYLIETTNVQQQPLQQQYRPVQQNPRASQTLRYVTLQPQTLQAQQAIQQPLYERPEVQGLKVVPAPNLQNLNPNFRVLQYQQEAPKQFRILDATRYRQEQPRVLNERPIAYLKQFPEPEKVRALPEQNLQENLSIQRPVQTQYYYRPVFRSNDGRRYEVPKEQPRAIEATKTPLSAIYVSKSITPKKAIRPVVRIEQSKDQYREPYNIAQASSSEQVNEQSHLEEQRSQLPPPKNNKAYTPEEFAGLIAAGYAVTPIPVGQHDTQVPQQAQSRSLVEPVYHRRAYYTRRNQYLPLRGDDAP